MIAAATNERAENVELGSGPTGHFLYEWVDHGVDSGLLRTYQRRRVDDPTATAEKVLVHDHQQWLLLGMSLSVDESMLAYLVSDASGTRVFIREIESGSLMELSLQESVAAVEFGPVHADQHSLFLLATEKERPSSVYALNFDPLSHFLGKEPSPSLIYHSDDPKVHVDVQRTKGCVYVAVHARTQSTNEVYLIQHAHDVLRLVRSREEDVQYHVDVGTDQDLFVYAHRQSSGETQLGREDEVGVETSLFQSSVKDLPLRNNLGVIVSSSSPNRVPSYSIFDFDIFREFVAFYERSTFDGKHRIRVAHRHNKSEDWTVTIPSNNATTLLSPAGNMHYDSSLLRFYLASPSVLRRTLEYNMVTRQFASPPSEAQCHDFVQRRILVPSKDGALVPLSFVYRTGAAAAELDNTPVRVVLIGYGGYGEPVSLAYDPMLQPLFARGLVVAFAHTRGGCELGRVWHLRGRGFEKFRAVEDYVACAEALVNDNVLMMNNRPVELIAKGNSAGGIVVGAAVNQRPDLFRKVLLTNAFLDLDATLRDPSLHLTQHEWDEYGNPLEDRIAAKAIAAICPFRNVSTNREIPQPDFLIIGSLDDQSVPVANSIVYGKKIREISGARVLLHIEREGGHYLHGTKVRVAAMEAAFAAAA